MNWFSGITITCFAASYTVSLALEISRLFFQARVHMLALKGFTLAGLVAHTLFLVEQARGEMAVRGIVPLSSWHDFCVLATWLLAASYLVLLVRRPDNTVGIFLLPLMLALIGVAFWFRDTGAFPQLTAVNLWRTIHGTALLLGTAAVTLGFATGIMYLVQAYRLKHKLPPRPGLRLPSLEWLQQLNRESLLISTGLLALGLLSGVVLNLPRAGDVHGLVGWSDPVVLSSAVLFVWLLAIVLFEIFYKPARQGRKVAYLTLGSFVFLLLVLGFVLLKEHATARAPRSDVVPLAGGAATVLAVSSQRGGRL